MYHFILAKIVVVPSVAGVRAPLEDVDRPVISDLAIAMLGIPLSRGVK